MKELVKPVKESEITNVEAYCEDGGCTICSPACTNCGIFGTIDDPESENEILF